MYEHADSPGPAERPRISAAAGAVLGVLSGLLLWFGIYPEPLLRIIRAVLPT
jgi:hypothetical protein